jgi:hypothetical protein
MSGSIFDCTNWYVIPIDLPLGFKFTPLGDDVTGAGLLLHQFLTAKACLRGSDHLYVLVTDTLDLGFSGMFQARLIVGKVPPIIQ